MELRKPLKVDVFFHNDESIKLDDLEIEVTMDECSQEPMTFYRVDAVSSFKDKSGRYGVIHCSGIEYITKTRMKVLETMMEECRASEPQ